MEKGKTFLVSVEWMGYYITVRMGFFACGLGKQPLDGSPGDGHVARDLGGRRIFPIFASFGSNFMGAACPS
jgi:hypothetical protein